jgi:chromosomal replication initiation ATPase DnaA
MKEDVFNQYVERVIDLFKISREDFFLKSRNRSLSDARYLVYYLCKKRNIQITYIKKYMLKNGYDLHHSSVVRGVKNVEEKTIEDRDYQTIISEMEKAVFI